MLQSQPIPRLSLNIWEAVSWEVVFKINMATMITIPQPNLYSKLQPTRCNVSIYIYIYIYILYIYIFYIYLWCTDIWMSNSAQLFSFMGILKEQTVFKSVSHTGRGTGQHTWEGFSHETLKKCTWTWKVVYSHVQNHNGQHIEQFCNLPIHMHCPWFDFLFEQPAFQLVVHRGEHFPEVHILASRACDRFTHILRTHKLFDGNVARPQSEIERLYYSKLLSGS